MVFRCMCFHDSLPLREHSGPAFTRAMNGSAHKHMPGLFSLSLSQKTDWTFCSAGDAQ